MADIQYMNLADIYKNVNGIISSQQANEANRRTLERDARKQKVMEQAAPLLKNNDYTGAANLAFDQGDTETGQGFQSQASEAAAAKNKNILNDLEFQKKVTEYAAPKFYQIAQIQDEPTRQKLAHSIIGELSPMMEQHTPGWTEKAMSEIGSGDINSLRTAAMRSLSVHDQIELKLKQEKEQLSQINTDRSFEASQQNQDLNRQVQMRGQDISSQNQGWAQTVDPKTGLPVWTQHRQEGMPAYSQTGATNKPMTEVQGKANIFGQRAEESHKILNDLESKINVPGLAAKQWLGGGVVGAAGNALLSDEQQKVDQAQRDFVNAALRNESGAAISQSEFENARKQYFPQPGDSKAVIEQKRKNRELEIKGLKELAGPNAPANKDAMKESSPSQNYLMGIPRERLDALRAEYESLYGDK